MADLDERISQFETLLDEMRSETMQARSALTKMQRERKDLERILGSKELKSVVEHRDRVTEEVNKILDICLGKEFSTKVGREDIRPALAEHLREWIQEIIRSEETKT
jgi:hypothetical protein